MILRSALAVLLVAASVADARDVLLHGKGKLVLWRDGVIAWEMPWGGIHDLHRGDDGKIYVQKDMREVCAIDPAEKKVVWSYDSTKSNGNDGKRLEVHAFQPLKDGNLMIAESGVGRIIEVDKDGKLLKEIPLKRDHPDAHRDTRLARKLENGHYLVCQEGDGAVREYDADGKVVWDFPVPMFGKEAKGGHGPEAFGNSTFSALRLKNGNTLLTTGNGHSVLEVTPAKEIVWKIEQKDLPGITLAWVTTLQVLPNGNYVIGNCHAGPGQPILIEIEPTTKKVVWQLDGFEQFGNDVSNTVVVKP
ncbi:PQQ-like beta-propeller repeat protein [Luteolibacter arcticus]|uniref:PQQ-like beta-propeller repeat protein n=1 Tax=Luteolibacter arcticus TaxID=1581411 RepID=A0ABT3GKA8_9BACT|nr:PQQ-like beta-propeller repeat protein [Luteolibacter arcticus]MCW1923959.1 PQQ-like beta-propeller repeat protein [Luteolibacter arcticus]